MTEGQTILWPQRISPDLEDILGTICFQVIDVVCAYRAGGHEIEYRAEAEQAFFLHRAIWLWSLHGAGWRAAMADEIRAIADVMDSKK